MWQHNREMQFTSGGRVGMANVRTNRGRSGFTSSKDIDAAVSMQYGMHSRKRHIDEDESLEDTGEEELEYMPAPDSPTGKVKDEVKSEDEDDDPLDAFMAGIEVQATKDRVSTEKRAKDAAAAPPGAAAQATDNKKDKLGRIDAEDMQEDYFKWLEENKPSMLTDDNEDDEIEYDEEGNAFRKKKFLSNKYDASREILDGGQTNGDQCVAGRETTFGVTSKVLGAVLDDESLTEHSFELPRQRMASSAALPAPPPPHNAAGMRHCATQRASTSALCQPPTTRSTTVNGVNGGAAPLYAPRNGGSPRASYVNGHSERAVAGQALDGSPRNSVTSSQRSSFSTPGGPNVNGQTPNVNGQTPNVNGQTPNVNGQTPNVNGQTATHQSPQKLRGSPRRGSPPAYANGTQVNGPPGNGPPEENGAAPLVTIRIRPDSQGRFGFNVKGGSDQNYPIIVSRVAAGSAADACYPRLNEGDQVVRIDGRDAAPLQHDHVVRLIRAARHSHLVLTVRPNAYLGEEVEEPAFEYVPETPHLAESVPRSDLLHQSLLLLRDALASGAAIHHFEQLYRKKPGLRADVCRTAENAGKNRYRDVLPYDATRVKLRRGPDYVNASYVNMDIPTSGIVNRYIAAQGPLPHTSADFWLMVWEQLCTTVVMLTATVERGRVKCEQYWPNLYECCDYGQLTVTSLRERHTPPGTAFRDFSLRHKQTREERRVSHMQYVAWPDHGVPEDEAFAPFCAAVRAARSGSLEPLLVHCSAGIGRTGVLILMETAMCLIEANEPVYPLDIVRTMRDQRPMLIQTSSQYKFVCEAILKAYNDQLVKPLAEYQHS